MPRRFIRANEERFVLASSEFTVSGDFTTIIWVRWLTFSGTAPQYFFSSGGFSTENSWNVHLGAPGDTDNWRPWVINAAGQGPAGGIEGLSATARDGLWTPFIVRRTGDDCEAFVFSRTHTSTLLPFAGSFVLPTDLYIGCREDFNADRFFDGELAHLAHFTTSLSNAAVDDLLDGANPQAVRDDYSATLQLYFPMNEASGNIVDVISGTVVGTDVNSVGAGLGTDPVDSYSTGTGITATISRTTGNRFSISRQASGISFVRGTQ